MNDNPVFTLKKGGFAGKILIYPNPTLANKSHLVKVIDEKVKTLVKRMTQLMKSAPGAGLSAPQVGVLQRVIVIDTSGGCEEVAGEILAMINPRILDTNGKSVEEEGCLSIPNIYAKVERPQTVRVEFLNLDGQREEITKEDRVARCIVHEIDHLDGLLFWDNLGGIKRNMLKFKFKCRQAKRSIN